MYLEVKIHQKPENKVFRLKQSSNNVSLVFSDAKPIKKDATDVFTCCKETQRVLRMYLEHSKLKISRE